MLTWIPSVVWGKFYKTFIYMYNVQYLHFNNHRIFFYTKRVLCILKNLHPFYCLFSMSSKNPSLIKMVKLHLYVQRSYLLHITFNSTQRRLKRAITPCYYKSDMRGRRSSRSWRTWWYRSNRSCRPPFPSARTAAGRKPSMARSAPTSVWGKVSYSRCLWLLCPLTSKQSFPFFFWVFESINRVIS